MTNTIGSRHHLDSHSRDNHLQPVCQTLSSPGMLQAPTSWQQSSHGLNPSYIARCRRLMATPASWCPPSLSPGATGVTTSLSESDRATMPMADGYETPCIATQGWASSPRKQQKASCSFASALGLAPARGTGLRPRYQRHHCLDSSGRQTPAHRSTHAECFDTYHGPDRQAISHTPGDVPVTYPNSCSPGSGVSRTCGWQADA